MRVSAALTASVGRVLDEVAVREAQLLLDLARGLVEQPRLLGGGQLPDALLFRLRSRRGRAP